MELKVKTKYDIGDSVIIDKTTKGIVMGIYISISQPEKAIIVLNKKYLVNVNGEVIEFEEGLLDEEK